MQQEEDRGTRPALASLLILLSSLLYTMNLYHPSVSAHVRKMHKSFSLAANIISEYSSAEPSGGCYDQSFFLVMKNSNFDI